MPKLNALHSKYKDQGLVLLGICSATGGEKMPTVAQNHNIQFPIAIDVANQNSKTYRLNGYPDYYIIDRAGRLRVIDCKNNKIEEAVVALLAEKE